MKKFAFLTLIAFFIFGAAPQQTIAQTLKSSQTASEFRAGYDHFSQSLEVSLASPLKRERALIQVMNGRHEAIREVVIIDIRATTFNFDMSNLPDGVYTVQVTAPSFKDAMRFKKF